MAERKQFEFFLLRYMPDVVKGEFVNFGVMALANGPNGFELIDVRFTKDWGRVLCLDPQADLEILSALEKEIRQEVGRTKDQVTLLKKMEDSFSNLVQISPVMPSLTGRTALAEIEDVARMFLETPKLRRTREPAGRQKILETMRDEFDKAGVLPLLNAVPAEPYTKTGDPFEFDFGYRFGGEIKLFHAVSMKGSVDSAVMLAARYPKIVPVMERIAGGAPMLTAVVENELNQTRSEIRFALGMMEESKIRIARAADMKEIAELARVELRA
ncbi:MAG TPA: DUF3037 domain-containing protein [Candidatus Sulfotelmatobacter sp.]|jgi:hypothetical protein|nr:DUF3037 domain-containing protein [Candidatus Sulfotelmatobacter sp.]